MCFNVLENVGVEINGANYTSQNTSCVKLADLTREEAIEVDKGM